ncbi:hypothetical protein BDR03DRAFT_210178 [Suillus americanus]|nr:hypothetical protein BDR03DRAFT_210178 [Suillus americanus]
MGCTAETPKPRPHDSHSISHTRDPHYYRLANDILCLRSHICLYPASCSLNAPIVRSMSVKNNRSSSTSSRLDVSPTVTRQPCMVFIGTARTCLFSVIVLIGLLGDRDSLNDVSAM